MPGNMEFRTTTTYTTILHLDVMKNANAIELVKSHYFNHSISMVLPDTVTVPQNLHNCLSKDTDYYRINKLHVNDLLNIEFIEAFVKKGEINLLTLENKIDLENSICVTPTGYLILSLLTDDYQALGLEGKPSVFSHKSHTRYNISMCPSSIAAWFYARNYNVCLCCQKFSQKIKYSLTIPTYEDTCNNTDIDFFEWLGVFSIDGDLSTKREDNYANTYQCPSPSIHVKQVQYLQWTGFFTRQKIQEVYNVLKQYVLSRDTLPWISLDIQGFADSAISFDLKEHMFLTDGDNSYTIVFHPKGKVVIRRNLSSNSKIKVHR